MRAVMVVLFLWSSGIAVAEPKWIKAAELASTAIEALAAATPDTAQTGAGVRIAWSEGTKDLDLARKELVAAFGNARLTIVDAGDSTGDIAMTVEDARGARAIVRLGTERGSIVVVARPSRVNPPGACVVPPAPVWRATVHAGGIDQRGEYHQSSITWRLTTSRLHDVDGDAVLDAFVPRYGKGDCPQDGLWEVYVMRGACGHWIGKVGPGWLTDDTVTVAVDPSGFRPLVFARDRATEGKGLVPEITTTTTTYRFGAKAYRKVKAVSRTDRCHHCAVWYCTTP